MSLQEFFAMGGYAFYVWTSYGVCFVVLLTNILLPVIRRKQFLRKLVLRQLANKQKRQNS